MKALIGLTLGLVVSAYSFASSPTDLEKWGDMTGKVGKVNTKDYSYSISDGVGTVKYTGKSQEVEFGAPGLEFDATPYLGKNLKLHGEIKTSESQGSSLWMRVDGKDNKMLQFDNGYAKNLKGTNDWTHFEVVLPIDKEAVDILVGALQVGSGQMSIRNVKFDVVKD